MARTRGRDADLGPRLVHSTLPISVPIVSPAAYTLSQPVSRPCPAEAPGRTARTLPRPPPRPHHHSLYLSPLKGGPTRSSPPPYQPPPLPPPRPPRVPAPTPPGPAGRLWVREPGKLLPRWKERQVVVGGGELAVWRLAGGPGPVLRLRLAELHHCHLQHSRGLLTLLLTGHHGRARLLLRASEGLPGWHNALCHQISLARQPARLLLPSAPAWRPAPPPVTRTTLPSLALQPSPYFLPASSDYRELGGTGEDSGFESREASTASEVSSFRDF